MRGEVCRVTPRRVLVYFECDGGSTWVRRYGEQGRDLIRHVTFPRVAGGSVPRRRRASGPGGPEALIRRARRSTSASAGPANDSAGVVAEVSESS